MVRTGGRGALRKLKPQCAIVSKLLPSVNRMTEARQFVVFCGQGWFSLDVQIGRPEWFREGS